MAFWNDVGNFFGGLFGGNKDDDERKRQQQQKQQQVKTQTPSPLNLNQNQPWARPNTPTLQPYTPQNNIPNQQPQQSELASLVQNKPKTVSQPLTPAQTDLFKGGNGYGVLTNDAMRERLPQRMAESVASQPKPKPKPVVVPNQNQRFMEQLQVAPQDSLPTPSDVANSIPGYNLMNRAGQARAVRDYNNSPAAQLKRMEREMVESENTNATLMLGINTAGKALQEAPKAFANLPGLVAQGIDWIGDNSSRAGLSFGQAMRGDDDATRQAQRDVLEARLANNASGRFAENWYRGVDDISKNIGLQKFIDDSDREIQRNVDTLVRNQGGLTEGQKIIATAGDVFGNVVDPLTFLPAAKAITLSDKLADGTRLADDIFKLGKRSEPNAPAIHENSPITRVEESLVQKESGISSPNRPEGMNKAQNFPAKTEPAPQPPVQPRPEPAYQTSPQTLQDAIGEPNAQLAPQRPVEPVTAPESPLQPIQRQLDEQMLEPPRPEPVAPAQVVDTPAQVQARQAAEQQMTQPKLTPEQVAEIEAQKALNDAPTEAMADSLKAEALEQEAFKREAAMYEKTDLDEALKYDSVDKYIEAKHRGDSLERAVDEVIKETERRGGITPSDPFIDTTAKYYRYDSKGLKEAVASRPRRDERLAQFYNQAHAKAKVPSPQAPKAEALEVGKTLKDGELYSTVNAYVSFGSDSTGGVIRYSPKGVGSVSETISYNKLSQKTRDELVSAELEYKNARANSTGPVAPGTVSETQIAKDRLELAQSNAIEELGLQEHASIQGARLADGARPTVQKPFLDRYTDWLENKWKSKEYSDAQIRDMEANPSKYRAQFESETSTPQAPKVSSDLQAAKEVPVDMKPLEEAAERGAKDQIKKDAQNVAKGEWAMKSLDEAAEKQKKPETAKSLKEPIDTKPPVGDSPAPASTKSGENYLQRTVSSDSSTSDVKRRLMSISDSVDSNDIDEIVDNIPKASQKIKDQIRKYYDTIEASEHGINRIQKEFRTDLADGTTGKISREAAEDMAHKRNKYTQDMQIAEKNLQNLIRKVEGRQSFKKRMLNSASNLVSYQQGNMLAGLPTQEKNIIGDIIATATQGIRHPIKTIKGVPEARFGSEMKKALRETTQVLPRTVSEVPRYIIRSVLSPVYAVNNSFANIRGAVFRNTVARTELARAGFKNPTKDQIRVQELRAGNAREVLINLNKNVGSTIVDPYKAAKASDEYFKVLDTATSHKDLARFAENTRKSSGILQEMMAGKNANGEVTPMSLLVNTLYPFTNPAINAGKKAIYMLDPRKASHVNEIKSIMQSPTRRNVARMQKMAGTAASIVAISQLLDDGVIAYNDEQATGDVSKPAGWSIKTGDDTYVPVRALGVFEPFVAAVGVTYKVMNGEVKTPEDGLAMMANSLPVVGANQFYGGAVRDIAKGDFAGYGVQSQAINRVKNLVPGVNNGLNRWMDRNQGKSTDSFSAYASKKDASGKTVPDFSTWLGNSVKMGFGDTEGLKPSLTTAGQRRTADNQGAFVKKTINDPATKQHNGAISNLTKYAQEQGFGKTMDDMFGTFDSDTGESKGGHFDTIQSAIWANTGKGGKETMLKSDKKMYDLSQQVLNGVRGDGDELLTIGGENLYSDVSMPNSKGSKNSSKPVSMASIKNAIAAASLPSDKKDELYQISQEASGLYDRRKAGEISWDDEQKMRSELADRERAIVQSSDGVKKLNGLMDKLEKEGFFEEGGLGSTRSGQTYLWNSLNAMLGEKGKTPAADWDDNKSSGWQQWGESTPKAKGSNLSVKSNSAPDIKRGERLFKAPTLVSTANKTKSRIPNISVKKGIHL